MTLSELEAKLLRLPPGDRLHLIQVLAQSLTTDWVQKSQVSEDTLSHFFRQSPLGQLAKTGELDLSRDCSLPDDRFVP